MSQWKWTDARQLCVEGRGWEDTKEFFNRLPTRAEAIVRPEIWDLSRHTTGITVRFSSNAREIRARWSLGDPTLSVNHTPIYAYSGLDLYAKTPEGSWRWVGQATTISEHAESILTPYGDLDGDLHEFRLYLPIYNAVTSLEIGVPATAAIDTEAPRPERPIAYYGTSIVHGAGASRPGMTHAAILGRRLDYPLLNLGFSGNAIMEPEVARFLAELDVVAYVLDPLPNMPAERIDGFAREFVRIIRGAHPRTPIVLVEDRGYPAGWITPGSRRENIERRRSLKLAFADLLNESAGPLHYIEGEGLLGIDGDGTNDGSHASDLGASRMADALEPVLKGILDERYK